MKEFKISTYAFNFTLRAVLGLATIYFGNAYLDSVGSAIQVGLNMITFLTSGILGFPGVTALYGIMFYQSL